MATGICPGDTFTYILERERILPEPKPTGDAVEDSKRLAAWQAHNERAKKTIESKTVTTWRLRFLASRDINRMGDRLNDSEWPFEALQLGLDGYDRYHDRKGREIPFTCGKAKVLGKDRENVVADSVLDAIPPRDVVELAKQILQQTVTEDELGNS